MLKILTLIALFTYSCKSTNPNSETLSAEGERRCLPASTEGMSRFDLATKVLRIKQCSEDELVKLRGLMRSGLVSDKPAAHKAAYLGMLARVETRLTELVGSSILKKTGCFPSRTGGLKRYDFATRVLDIGKCTAAELKQLDGLMRSGLAHPNQTDSHKAAFVGALARIAAVASADTSTKRAQQGCLSKETAGKSRFNLATETVHVETCTHSQLDMLDGLMRSGLLIDEPEAHKAAYVGMLGRIEAEKQKRKPS